MAESPISGRLEGIVVSVFTSAFALSLLYRKSSARDLWLAIFLVIQIFVLIVQRVLNKCCYTRAETNDVDKTTLHRLVVIIQLTVRFVIVKLVMDIFTFQMAITHMNWQAYVNVGTVVISFVLAIFARIEF